MAVGPHVSLSAENLATVAGFNFSNSIFTSLIASSLILLFAYYVSSKLKSTDRPTGIQNFVELILDGLLSLMNSVTGDRLKSYRFFPFVATFFMFILLNNWLGLMPGVGTISVMLPHETVAAAVLDDQTEVEELAIEGSYQKETELHAVPIFRPGTADINTTLALAIFSVLMTQVMGFSYLSFSYFSKFFNFSSPIFFFVGILELFSEFAKIISFAFRLFGNIFAGEVLLVVIAFLVPVIVPMPFYGLELFVGFIQALVFSMLTLVFFTMATQAHGDH